MLHDRRMLTEALTAIGLLAAPFALPPLGFAPNTGWSAVAAVFDLGNDRDKGDPCSTRQ